MADPVPAPEELVVENNLSRTVVRLYTNDLSNVVNLSLADIVEADFSGYEAIETPPWGETLDNPAIAKKQINCAAITYEHDGGDVANVVKGFYVTLKTTCGEALLGPVKFPRPVTFAAKGDKFTFAPEIQLNDLTWPE